MDNALETVTMTGRVHHTPLLQPKTTNSLYCGFLVGIPASLVLAVATGLDLAARPSIRYCHGLPQTTHLDISLLFNKMTLPQSQGIA